MLSPCPNCREMSVAVKIYRTRGDKRKKRVEFCLNHGCGYRKELPFPSDLIKSR